MPDLIDEFFKRDLTEKELDALERQIEDQDQAMRLLGRADKHYRATGLPEPGAADFWERFRIRPGAILWARTAGVFAVACMGLVIWQWRQAPEDMKPQAITAMEAAAKPRQAPAKAVPERARRVEKGPRAEAVYSYAASGRSNAKKKESMPLAAQMAPMPAAGAPMAPAASALMAPPPPLIRLALAEPVLGGETMDRVYAAAFFRVTMGIPGHLLVRVITPEGLEVRVLEDLDAPSGTRLLSWDGKDSQGKTAPSGHYILEANHDVDLRLPFDIP
jgi:hypothetical protein